MRPVRVFAKSYGPFTDVSWEIPAGVTAIVGRNDGEGINSNGAGKTKLLEILPLALFGPSSALAEHLTVGGVSTTCEVGLEFEHNGDRYRVVRTYNAKGRGSSTTAFERKLVSGDGWASLAHERQDETQAAIERTLAISEATFEQSVFSRQFARHFANPALPPRERKEILAEALELGVYDLLLDGCKRTLAVVDSKLASLKGSLSTFEQMLEQRPAAEAELAQIRGSLVALEAEERAQAEKHAALQISYEQARAARGKVDDARQMLAAREQTLAGLKAKLDAADGAGVTASLLRLELEQLEELAEQQLVRETKVEALKMAAAERARLLQEHAALTERGQRERMAAAALTAEALLLNARVLATEAQIESPADLCDRCGQPVAGEAREVLLASLRDDLAAVSEQYAQQRAAAKRLDEAADELVAKAALIVLPQAASAEALAEALEALAAARAAQTQAEGVRARLEAAVAAQEAVASAEFVDGRARAEQALTVARDALQQIEASVLSEERAGELARDALGAKVALEQAQQLLGRARTDLGGAEQRLRTIEEAAAKVTEAVAERTELEARGGVLADLARAYSRDGIPALIMESTAIPQIEREAQRILEALGVPFRVELRTQAAQKTTDRLKDTLDVVVHEPNGERRYESYSGGERARINVALRIALARLLAHRRGASMEVFALDEVEHLDAAGVTKLAELLRELQREIPVVLFISHVETLTEAFDQTLCVVRESGSSRLEVAA